MAASRFTAGIVSSKVAPIKGALAWRKITRKKKKQPVTGKMPESTARKVQLPSAPSVGFSQHSPIAFKIPARHERVGVLG